MKELKDYISSWYEKEGQPNGTDTNNKLSVFMRAQYLYEHGAEGIGRAAFTAKLKQTLADLWNYAGDLKAEQLSGLLKATYSEYLQD